MVRLKGANNTLEGELHRRWTNNFDYNIYTFTLLLIIMYAR